VTTAWERRVATVRAESVRSDVKCERSLKVAQRQLTIGLSGRSSKWSSASLGNTQAKMPCCVKKAVRVFVKLEQKLLVMSSRSWNVKCRVGLAARRAGGRRPLSNSMVAPPPDCSESIKEKAGTCSVAQHNPAARGCTSHFSGPDQPLPQFRVLIRQRVRGSLRAHEMELAVSQADDATGAIGKYPARQQSP
jgi:hypothetical protein